MGAHPKYYTLIIWNKNEGKKEHARMNYEGKTQTREPDESK